MKLALIQHNPVAGALRHNMETLVCAVRRAGKMNADLCIASEMALCGHNVGDQLLRPGFAEECRMVLDAGALMLERENGLPPLLLGAPIANPVPQGKRLQNCAVLLHEGKFAVVGRKVLLSSDGACDDPRYFEPGVALGVLHLKGWRMAVTVGEDVWNDATFWKDRRQSRSDPVSDFIAGGGADCIINITALPFEQGLPGLHQRMLTHLAAHHRMPVASVNLAGGNDSLVYYGGSLCCGVAGNILARAPFFAEAVLVVDLTDKERGSIAPELQAEETLWQAIVLGTRDFVRKCGFDSVVLGLSGGVDSSLVAAIAVEALGPDKVTGLLMPSPYSSQGSIDDSIALAQSLGIAVHTLSITPMLQAFTKMFDDTFGGGLGGLAEENTQARIRGTLVMAYANRFGALPLATGNKSEAAVGYATLYGDMAGGLAPIGDLYKRQVYELCRWRNAHFPNSIPEAVLNKEPSAELKPGQKDSDSLPPYAELDPLLADILENGDSLAQLAEKGYDRAIASDIMRMVRQAEFKRHQAAPVLHLSPRGFGSGRRMPIAVGGPPANRRHMLLLTRAKRP